MDAATDAKLWEFKTGSWVESSPAVVNGVVYFGSNDSRLYALDATTGKKLWDFKAPIFCLTQTHPPLGLSLLFAQTSRSLSSGAGAWGYHQ